MSLEKILNEWDADSIIDSLNLGEECLRIHRTLHTKYYRLFVQARAQLFFTKKKHDRVFSIFLRYYTRCPIDNEEQEEFGLAWNQSPVKILDKHIDKVVNSESHVSVLVEELAERQLVVDTLEHIIKILKDRGYQLRAAIDYAKFQGGG